ncbi:MAG: extracellular solute-binding protein, partial [SAR324 cluster bacterium]|nr:extracellular solute-binding protein [SAR324 cluster bacterium]
DYFKKYAGVDVKKIFPASDKRDSRLVNSWTWANFEKYAEKIHKGGHSFGAPISQQTDSGNWISSIFHSFGSVLVDAGGNITVNSDNTREVLEFMKKLTQWMPPDVYAWDNAGNNRWLISGKGGAIVNPPSAWAVAKRIYLKDKSKDAVTHVWHADQPIGPRGHFRCYLPFIYGIWKFSKQQNASKDLLRYLLSREINYKLITAGQGYDVPALPSYWDHPVWKTIGPPKGGQYNYPVRGGEKIMVTGFPAPPPIAAQITVQQIHSIMVAKVAQAKEPVNEVISWAESEMEGFMRG